MPTHIVKLNLITNLSVHLLQETLHVTRVTVQFTPLILQGPAASEGVTDYTCALETISNTIKIKLGCRRMFGAIWQETL